MPNPAVAVVGGTLVSGAQQSSAARSAARSQERSARAGISAQERAQQQAQEFADPFRQAGLAAVTPLLQSLGIQIPQELTPQGIVQGEVSELQGQIADIDRQIQDVQSAPQASGKGRFLENLRRRDDVAALEQQRSILQSQLDEQPAVSVGQPVQPATAQPLAPDDQLAQINPLVSFLRQEGFEDIQEQAAAQGRLRSGGTLQDLARFNTQLTSTIVPQLQQQRFNQLFNLLGLGANVATGQGTQQLNTASNIGNLLAQQGQAQAAGALGQAQAIGGTISGLSGILGAQQGGLFGQTAPTATAQAVPSGTILGSEALQGARGTGLGGL